ncbi:MAG: methionyl-tRNA formyltransferase [Spirochaetia bacterium]|jgi:methionyl-tRNA formyltransferase|nr:methionyl-tRNA formyltransferase [Spirochaetia bacterium]
MRVLFAGSPEIAVPSIAAIAARHELVGVLTNPPSAKGRGLCFSCTPVTEAAEALGVPVLSPQWLGNTERELVAALQPELLVVFAYGHIFGPKFMALFPRGGINAHPSLLPRWRGCAPIPFAILHRDTQTGVSVQRVAPRMDSGDILFRRFIDLDGTETTGSLSALAASIGAEMLAQAIDDIAAGRDTDEPQDEAMATYCRALTKDEGHIDWATSAFEIDARCRAFYPWPGTYSTLAGERLSLLEMRPYADEGGNVAVGTVVSVDKSKGIMVQTGEGLIALERLQLRGKKPMHWKDFANGARGLVGSCLGAS